MIKGYHQFILESNTEDLFPDEWKEVLDIDGDNVILHHFGNPGIEEFDPEHWGENRYTRSESWWGKPRTYFYTNLDDKERIVGGTHYTIKYPLNKLYPFNADPLNFYDECADELEVKNVPVRRQVICISTKAQNAGYDGMIYRWEKSFVAAIWVKVPVQEVEEPKIENRT